MGALAVVAVIQIKDGYDLSPLLYLVGAYAALGLVAWLLIWFFSTRFGKKLEAAGKTAGTVILKGLFLLVIGAIIVWLLGLLFGSMPWWAAVIILLLLFK